MKAAAAAHSSACQMHWYVFKAKREAHKQTQNKLKTKYPTHNFDRYRAVKKARRELNNVPT
jgi:hypothetical protein